MVLPLTMTMKTTRAQAALEFVMTYSWALLILIIIFVMAWQLGFFTFGGQLKPGNMGFWGVTPFDYKLNATGSFSISLLNEVGANVTVEDIEARMGSTVQTWTGTQIIESGGSSLFLINGLLPGKAGDRFDVILSVDYNDTRTLLVHKSTGKLWGSYEK